ncbi:MAG: RNA polymerase sigma factor [Roseibacillus sp.]
MDDVRQQVFLKLWQRLGTYQKQSEDSKFRSWLAVVIRNVAIDWLRGQKNRDLKRGTDESVDERTISAPEITVMIEREWQRHVVATALERLKPVFSSNAFEVLRLSLEGVSAEEVGERLSIRSQSVYVLKSRVKKRVQQEIAQIRLEQESLYDQK